MLEVRGVQGLLPGRMKSKAILVNPALDTGADLLASARESPGEQDAPESSLLPNLI